MTRDVVSIAPNTPVPHIARLLVDHEISAVPVVDETGAPVGVVSEGDLIGRREPDARRDWWLALLAEGEKPGPDLVEKVEEPKFIARDVMSTPVVMVSEETDANEIVRLLSSYRIKRVPVVRDRRLVGIVSRADILRGISDGHPVDSKPAAAPHHHGFVQWVDEHFERGLREHAQARETAETKPAAGQPQPGHITAKDFRHLVADFHTSEYVKAQKQREAVASARKEKVKKLVDTHISDVDWKEMVHKARVAAERGDTEFLLLRFPSQTCTDGGRAINAAEHGWATTLQGEPAEIYLRWERDLRPGGFRIAARVIDFPDGIPGDIGLFLVWGG